jgi:hypothetical protein
MLETASQALFDQLVSIYYLPMEIWYTRTIIDKVRDISRASNAISIKLLELQAHRLSSPDTLQTPITTTTPDDVFYILKSVTSRLLTTGSRNAVERTLQQLREVIDRDYASVIKRKMDEVYKNSGPTPSNVRPDRIERENRVSFIVSIRWFIYES